jgi:hypothetical protein
LTSSDAVSAPDRDPTPDTAPAPSPFGTGAWAFWGIPYERGKPVLHIAVDIAVNVAIQLCNLLP